MTTHELKSWPEFFEPVFKGVKNFELRIDDRKFNVGDILLLREWDDKQRKYTGRSVRRIVTYKLEGLGQGAIPPFHGLARGYAILSLSATH